MYCDLHTHSIYSDGTETPESILDQAQTLGLKAVALTDHNTIYGLSRFLEAARGRPLEAIPGTEFSTSHGGKELHILALYIPEDVYDQVTAYVALPDQWKQESNRALAEALNRAGIPIDLSALEARTPGSRVNRPHFAAALVELGYASSIADAFNGYLSVKGGFYKPPKRLDALETIRFIREKLRAVPVLAHPFLNLNEQELRAFLPLAIEAGLVGIETDYSTYAPETTALSYRIAADFSLLPSGGSDYHGDNKPDIAIGTGRGTLAVPMAYAQGLRAWNKTNQKATT